MIDFNLTRWIVAALIGTLVTVGFDAILHGVSQGGHGILDRIWEGEVSERKTSPILLSEITWHIIADGILAIFVSLLIVLIQLPGIAWAILVGLCIGGISSVQWIHTYAAYETSWRVPVTLAALSVIQLILASIAISLTYWGV
jgi:hypothetical protein